LIQKLIVSMHKWEPKHSETPNSFLGKLKYTSETAGFNVVDFKLDLLQKNIVF
jgi:hypothetical protein